MKSNPQIGNLGEIRLIKLIEELVLTKTGKGLISDDACFFNLKEENSDHIMVLNSDMLVSTTDVPPQMSFYQIGRKSVIINVSDLIVKSVRPKGIIISLGLPRLFRKSSFIDLMSGIIDCCIEFDLDYIGGDINETKELIINPTVFGFKHSSGILYRKGIKSGDILVSNKKFGLTGVGFDILLNKKRDYRYFENYKRSIRSVLEPEISKVEAFILSEKKFTVSSIDSSDGLSKSLYDLLLSNPNLGFEIIFNEDLIDSEAFQYSEDYNVPLVDIVLDGGEEYIQLFVINPKDFSEAKKEIQARGGQLFKIGKVISEEKIYILKDGKVSVLKNNGFEHFRK